MIPNPGNECSGNGTSHSWNSDHGGSDAAERALLATVLRSGRLDESASQVRERDFRVFAHQLIWEAIVNLSAEGKVVDTVSVAHFLNSQRRIGHQRNCPDLSYEYLAELLEFSALPAGIPSYVQIVRENADRGRLIRAANEIYAIARSGGPVDELLERIQQEVPQLDRAGIRTSRTQIPRCPVPASQLAPEGTQLNWVLQGYLAPKGITLLTSLWKAGKSTFLAHLVKAIGCGEPLAGLSVTAGHVLIVSEESQALWAGRRDKLGIADHALFYCRPFLGKPAWGDWFEFIEHLAQLTKKRNLVLVCLDTFSAFNPCQDENDAAEMLKALTPLHAISEAGAAVLLSHHPRKGDGNEGQASRGSGALPGFVDIIVEMRRSSSTDRTSRQRVLTAYSRYDETPSELVIELAEDGSRYLSLGSKPEADRKSRWATIGEILPGDPPGKTPEELLEVWPNERKPGKRTLEQDLSQGAELGRWSMAGAGRKGDPFRFWTAQNSIRAPL